MVILRVISKRRAVVYVEIVPENIRHGDGLKQRMKNNLEKLAKKMPHVKHYGNTTITNISTSVHHYRAYVLTLETVVMH